MNGKNGKLMLIAAVWAVTCVLNCSLLPPRLAHRVTVEKVLMAPLPLLVRAAGNLNPKDSNTVKAQFDGSVKQKLFREGQHVKRGELLMELGREKIQLDYQTKKDALDNAVSDLIKARREVRLQKALFAKQAVAYSSVEDAGRAVVKAEQSLRSAQETFHEMQATWDSALVTAPIDGTVVKDAVGEDKTIALGKDLVTVADVSEFTVHARVDELDIRSVHEGQTASVRLPVYAGTALPAVVTEIGTAPESNGLLSVPVVLRITSVQGLLLRPKLTADVTIHTGATPPLLSVPSTAVANADGETKVWTLDSLNRLRARKVELGRSNGDRVEITKGLDAGDTVVVSADSNFSDGMQIILKSIKKPPTRPGAKPPVRGAIPPSGGPALP